MDMRFYAPLCAGKVGKIAKIKLKVLYQGSFKEIAKRLKNNYFKIINNQYLFSFYLFLGGTTAPLFSHTRRPCLHDRSFLYPKKMVSFPVTPKKGLKMRLFQTGSRKLKIFLRGL